MQYRVICEYISGIKITFGDSNQERTFGTRKEAEQYLTNIEKQDVLPHDYQLLIERVDSESA